MIEYRRAVAADYEQIRTFLAGNGWEQRVEDQDRFRQMIENASLTVVAFDGERLIGFARALTDGVSNGYIGTVAVAADMRGRGIGGEMVRRLMGDDRRITWMLRAGHGSSEFWKKMGFTPSAAAMERPRTL